MCGIFAYIGDKKAAPVLARGLSKLDYRGYDSVGFCLLNKGCFEVYKNAGSLEKNRQAFLNRLFLGKIGICHTRWATHGKPTAQNSHPHFDCRKEIAVVHNGIIENYSELKKMLQKEGHRFVSQTDTEVIAHLIEKYLVNNDLEKAVLRAVNKLAGSFALAILYSKESKIIAVKKGSGLILGIGKKEMLLASDILALQPFAEKAVFLEDNEMAIIDQEKFILKSFFGKTIQRPTQAIKRSGGGGDGLKNSFEHFMLKEIFEQADLIDNALARTNKISPLPERIIISACGTSYYTGLLGKLILEKELKIPTEVVYGSEFHYFSPVLTEKTLLILVSQSGETADTLNALKIANQKKIETLSIVNVEHSTLARKSDRVLFLNSGPEIGVASTKAFTSQVAIFLGLAGKRTFLQEKIRITLQQSENIKKIAQEVRNFNNCLFLGRGFNYPVALEGALKLKEVSYIHAEGYPAGEMKHGPIALIDKRMPVVFLATQDSLSQKVFSNMQEVKSRDGKILAVCNKKEKFKGLADWAIEVPRVSEEYSPIINAIPLQLLAYHAAVLRGLNPDKPRNLAKSVTVE